MIDAEETLHMLQQWSEAYPTSIFPETTQSDIEYINAVNPHLSGRLFAHAGRHFIKRAFLPAIETIEQLMKRVDELEKVCKAMSEDGWLLCGPEGLSEAQERLLNALEGIEE